MYGAFQIVAYTKSRGDDTASPHDIAQHMGETGHGDAARHVSTSRITTIHAT